MSEFVPAPFVYMQTRTGLVIQYEDPIIDDITLEDIAQALSRLYRFNGHSDITVAQHSVMLAGVARDRGLTVVHQRVALMHDAHEAYVGDMPTPLKRLCPHYVRIEQIVAAAVRRRFRLPPEVMPTVKKLDRAWCNAEADAELGHRIGPDWPDVEPLEIKIKPWSKERAKREFLAEAARLEIR